MNRIVLVFMGIFALLAAPHEKANAKEKLAVLDLKSKWGVEKGFAEAYSVLVRDEIHSYGEYEVMSTEDLQTVMSREALLQAMGCDGDGACLVNFGRAIGTRFMVAGSLSKLGSTYNISLRILDTKGENAGVVRRASNSCKCSEDELIIAVQRATAELMGKKTKDVREVRKAPEAALQKVKTGRLTVSVSPSDAQIRILNIKPRYNAGMELPPGRYHLEVSRGGHQSRKKWVKLDAGDNLDVGISLQPEKLQTAAALFSRPHLSGKTTEIDSQKIVKKEIVNSSEILSKDIIYDQSTGLTWQKGEPGVMGTKRANHYCNELDLVNYSDWRLPNFLELMSAYKIKHRFPNLASFPESSTYLSSDFLMGVYFDTGDRVYMRDANIRCVRGGQSSGKTVEVASRNSVRKEIINPSEILLKDIVYDRSTGFTWQKSEPGIMRIKKAIHYCRELNLANYSDWRLPNVLELMSAYKIKHRFPHLASFPKSSTYLTSEYQSEHWVWGVYFDTGDKVGYMRDAHVRCVRAGR